MYRIFDIETIGLPEPELKMLCPKFDRDEVKLGNYKDPEKIAAKLAEAEASHFNDFVAKAALNAITAKVAMIGVLTESKTEVLSGDESDTLEAFWNQWRQAERTRWIGYNIKAFDLPFLVRRSWLLHVDVPRNVLEKNRYWHESFVDLREAWACGDHQTRTGGLDGLCRAFGLGGKIGDGKDFASMWQTDRDGALAYNADELKKMSVIAWRMGLISTSATPKLAAG